MRRGLLLTICILCLVGSTAGVPGGTTEMGTFDGVIRPTATVPLGIPIEGRLAEVLVERGDSVRAGQYLAALESEVEELDLALAQERAARVSDAEAARVRIEHARLNLEARQNLSGIIAEEELRAMRTEQRLAEIALVEAEELQRISSLEVDRARARLTLRRIASPLDGVVTERFLSPGELVGPGKPVLTVVRVNPLRVEVLLPVEFLGRVTVGDEAEILPDAPGTGPFRARIEVVDPVVDPASHTFGVRLVLPNPGGRITAGVRCHVRFGKIK